MKKCFSRWLSVANFALSWTKFQLLPRSDAPLIAVIGLSVVSLATLSSSATAQEDLPWLKNEQAAPPYDIQPRERTYGQGYGQENPVPPGSDTYRPYEDRQPNYDAPPPPPPSDNYRYDPPPPPRSDYGRPPPRYDEYGGRPPDYRPPRDQGRYDGPPPPHHNNGYSNDEIVAAGHRFFGTVSSGLAKAVEYVFQQNGRPNGYILGEDAGGAFVAGLRYGEGMLYTKNAGQHRVYWQGPSIGYDFGAEGSKAMILVYNLYSPDDIYNTFSGVSGSAYLVGGVGVTYQKSGHVTLAPIRAGVGARLGANVGYLKYTRRPTWNPF